MIPICQCSRMYIYRHGLKSTAKHECHNSHMFALPRASYHTAARNASQYSNPLVPLRRGRVVPMHSFHLSTVQFQASRAACIFIVLQYAAKLTVLFIVILELGNDLLIKILLGLALVALQILVDEEGKSATDEDHGVHAQTEARGVGCCGGGSCAGAAADVGFGVAFLLIPKMD